MPAKRLLWTVVLSLAAAAAALWAASRLTPAQALVPLALFALASIAAALAFGGVARRVAGGLVAALGAAPIVVATGDVPTGARALAVTGGALMVIAGMLMVLMGQRMPRLGAKYRTPSGAKGSGESDDDLWRALSDGEDPTTRGT